MEPSMKARLRKILLERGDLDISPDSLADDADLYDAGLSSLATVNLLMAVEAEFDIEIPDELLTRGLFQSIDTLALTICRLQAGPGPSSSPSLDRTQSRLSATTV